MTKKRQQDFAKIHLKPGRLLSKRRNITQTSFKSKKIIMPKEKIVKMKSEFTIEDCIRKIKSANSEKDKISYFNELNRLIHRQPDTINVHLSQILETVLDYIRDPHDGVRNSALKTVVSVLEVTDDLQLHSYADLLNNNISAIMKNPNQKIAPASLILLDCMLKNHPDLICHNITILYDLLPTERKHYTRKIITEKETYQYSERGEINALGHINAFLKNMLKSKNDLAKNEDDDKDVYMDSKESWSLEIYAGGGLQPVDIERAYSKQFDHQTDPFDKVEKLTQFIDTLLKLIPSYFCQIVGSESNIDDNTFRCDPITDLSILIQLLCNVSELAEQISYTEAEEEIAAFLKEGVFSSYRKRFPFELHTAIPGTSLLPLALLNTSVCFLFMKFLASNDNCDDDGELIEKYLKKFFFLEKTYSSEIKCHCIPLFVKMIQLYSYMIDVPQVIYLLLKQFVLLLKTRINHPNKKMLINLFFNMSLHPAYKFWVDSAPMELWYEWLLSHLKENINKLDKKLVRIIRKIAKLRHSSFLKHLDFSVIKPLLRHRNDELKETAICLLHNMDIDSELLKNVSDVISVDSFPKKFTINLIRMLHVRFTQYPESEKPYVDYIEFLFNIAVDIHNFYNNRMVDFEANEYTKALKALRNGHSFSIFPSRHWKEHSKVFEVCQKSLENLPLGPVCIVFMKFVKELLHSTATIPIHCALAILKLDMPEMTDKYHRLLMRDLNFSCLLTTSVLTQMSMDDEWYKWNVCELMTSMSFTKRSAIEMLDILEQGHFGKPDGLVVYHFLRVLMVFVTKRLFNFDCRDTIKYILHVLKSTVEDRCTDKTMKLQPLYIQLYNFIIEHY